MSARRRKLKKFEEKIRNIFLVLALVAFTVVMGYAAATNQDTVVIVFVLDVLGWMVAAVLILTAALLLMGGIRKEAPRAYGIGWATVLVALPFLIVHGFNGTTRATGVQLYLLGNFCALMLLWASLTSGFLSPE